MISGGGSKYGGNYTDKFKNPSVYDINNKNDNFEEHFEDSDDFNDINGETNNPRPTLGFARTSNEDKSKNLAPQPILKEKYSMPTPIQEVREPYSQPRDTFKESKPVI